MKKEIKTFLEECNKNIELEESEKISMRESAYNICDLCNKSFDYIMPEFEEIMDIACDLELPKEYCDRDIKDWGKLKEIIKKYR